MMVFWVINFITLLSHILRVFFSVFSSHTKKKESGEKENDTTVPKLTLKVKGSGDGSGGVTNVTKSGESNESASDTSTDADSGHDSEQPVVLRRSMRLSDKREAHEKVQKELLKLRRKRKKVKALFFKSESKEYYVFASGHTKSVEQMKSGTKGKVKEEHR